MTGVLVWRRISITPLKAKPASTRRTPGSLRQWFWSFRNFADMLADTTERVFLHFKPGNYFSIMIMASLKLISHNTTPLFRDVNFLSGARILSPLVPCFASPVTPLDSDTRQSSPSPKTLPHPPALIYILTDTHLGLISSHTHTTLPPNVPHPAPLANHFKGRCYQTRGRPSEANPSRDPISPDQTRRMDF